MYTRCPECKTTFKVTPTQLNAHEGLVRCGICSHTFHADQDLFETLPEKNGEDLPAEDGIPLLEKPKRKRARAKKKTAAKRHKKKKDDDSPEISGLPWQKNRGPRVKITLWTLANIALLLLFAGQYTFFYRDSLARIPELGPLMHQFCQMARCEIEPPHNIKRIELLQTMIAPHPKYENSLRLRAILVNRAEFDQDYPDMEVNLTDSAGLVVARRVFAADQYLETPAAANDSMFQNVAMAARLDVTNPDGKAVGYEIRLVNP